MKVHHSMNYCDAECECPTCGSSHCSCVCFALKCKCCIDSEMIDWE